MKINSGRLVVFSIVFILVTVIGTLSHELGHIAVARALGYHTTVHYASMNSYSSKMMKLMDDRINFPDVPELTNNAAWEKASFKPERHRLWITMGGPIQTMLTGMLGLFILQKRRKKRRSRPFKFIDWLAVFLALFWLREVFNLGATLVYGYLKNKPDYFVGNGDEIKISDALGLPSYMIPVICGAIGLIICAIVVFKYVPKKDRPTFILSGAVGGGLGFYLWMDLVGPMLLP